MIVLYAIWALLISNGDCTRANRRPIDEGNRQIRVNIRQSFNSKCGVSPSMACTNARASKLVRCAWCGHPLLASDNGAKLDNKWQASHQSCFLSKTSSAGYQSTRLSGSTTHFTIKLIICDWAFTSRTSDLLTTSASRGAVLAGHLSCSLY